MYLCFGTGFLYTYMIYVCWLCANCATVYIRRSQVKSGFHDVDVRRTQLRNYFFDDVYMSYAVKGLTAQHCVSPCRYSLRRKFKNSLYLSHSRLIDDCILIVVSTLLPFFLHQNNIFCSTIYSMCIF